MAEPTGIRGRNQPASVPYPAKLTLPARRPAIIHRQRLIDLLSEHVSRRITIVTAPAGYGKTTLLLDFAQSWDAPVCWYALDERDRELRTFLTYWVACGREQFPSFGQGVEEALSAAEDVSPERWVDLMVTAVQDVGRPFVLVFDDFHYLDETPPELRQVLEGGRDVLNKEISLDDAQHLADVTEGWVAALILMADKVQAARTSISLEQLKISDTLFQYINLEQFSVQ